MTLEDVLSRFSPTSPYRKLLPALVASDDSASAGVPSARAYQELAEAGRTLGADDARALLRAALELPFASSGSGRDVASELVFQVVAAPAPFSELVPVALEGYGRASDRTRAALLTLFGESGTDAGASALIAVLREHGWPDAMFERVIRSFFKLVEAGDELFPELLTLAGPYLGAVTDVLMAALRQGTLEASKLASLTPTVSEHVRASIAHVEAHQSADGIAWRFAESYEPLRAELGAWLDIAGYLPSAPDLTLLLVRASRLVDPRLAMFAAGALVRSGATVPEATFERIASSHETRAPLFQLLRQMRRLDLFPLAHRTWDGFAASDMVSWLASPHELGREPDQIEKMAVFGSGGAAGTGHDVALYVWRFRSGHDPWCAGISGPYAIDGEPVPTRGGSTFSRFDAWDGRSPEEHASAALKTVAEWKRASST